MFRAYSDPLGVDTDRPHYRRIGSETGFGAREEADEPAELATSMARIPVSSSPNMGPSGTTPER